jgi:uncharacterized protein (DUF1778 family)
VPSSDFVFKAVRFSSRGLSEWVDAASAVVAQERTGNPEARGNRSAFVAEAAVELAHVVLNKKLTSAHYLPGAHQPRAKSGRCLVLTRVGKDNKRLVNALHRVTGWNKSYLINVVATAPEILLEAPTREEVRLLKKVTKPLGAKVRTGTAVHGVRTNVAIRPEDIGTIEEAARRTNHHISPFLTWASLLKARDILGGDILVEEDFDEDVESQDEGERITITSRLPLSAVDRMDEYCSEQKWTRAEFVEEACSYLANAVGRQRITKNLLPGGHSLNGERKMVSVKVDASVKTEMTVNGACLNHTTTGFLVWAILAYLNHTNPL